jgi:hypothetical protein
LALAKIGHQHDLAVREFKGIVMSRRPVEIDLPKRATLCVDLRVGKNRNDASHSTSFSNATSVPGHQAHGNTRLRRISETARDGIGKLC